VEWINIFVSFFRVHPFVGGVFFLVLSFLRESDIEGGVFRWPKKRGIDPLLFRCPGRVGGLFFLKRVEM